MEAGLLKDKLTYCPSSGKLRWKKRDRGQFKNNQIYKAWNTKYSDKFAGYLENTGYLRVRIQSKTYQYHRVCWALYHGQWPKGQIDHVDGDKQNNRIGNLRDVENSVNSKNKGIDSRNKSGVVGVRYISRLRKWQADIRSDGVYKYLGVFENKRDAVIAREKAEGSLGFYKNGRRVYE